MDDASPQVVEADLSTKGGNNSYQLADNELTDLSGSNAESETNSDSTLIFTKEEKSRFPLPGSSFLGSSDVDSISSTSSPLSLEESLAKFESELKNSLTLSSSPESTSERTAGIEGRHRPERHRVRFGVDGQPLNDNENCEAEDRSSPRRICCEQFMEETITVPELEEIFDIDFEKDWVSLVMSYRPKLATADPSQLTHEERRLVEKVRKAEKKIWKREEVIRRYVKKAKTPEEEATLRREITQRMSARAKEVIEKRKAERLQQKAKEELQRAKGTGKYFGAAGKALDLLLGKASKKTAKKKTFEVNAAGDAGGYL